MKPEHQTDTVLAAGEGPTETQLEIMPRADGGERFEPLAVTVASAKATALALVVRTEDPPEEQLRKSAEARRMRIDIFRATRIAAEKLHKELKSGILEIGRKLDGAERAIRTECESVEEHLLEQEKFAENQRLRIADETRARRAAEIAPFLTGPLALDLAQLTEEQWSTQLADARELHALRIERERKEQEAAAERARQEAEERERVRLENERLKAEAAEREAAAKAERERIEEERRREREAAEAALKAEREAAAAREREIQEKARKEREEAEKKAAAERAAAAKAKAEADRIAAEERAAREKLEREAAAKAEEERRREREAAEAALKAEREAVAKAKAEADRLAAEAAAKAEAERRKERESAEAARIAAAAPVADKLRAYASAVQSVDLPALADARLSAWLRSERDNLLHTIEDRASRMVQKEEGSLL